MRQDRLITRRPNSEPPRSSNFHPYSAEISKISLKVCEMSVLVALDAIELILEQLELFVERARAIIRMERNAALQIMTADAANTQQAQTARLNMANAAGMQARDQARSLAFAMSNIDGTNEEQPQVPASDQAENTSNTNVAFMIPAAIGGPQYVLQMSPQLPPPPPPVERYPSPPMGPPPTSPPAKRQKKLKKTVAGKTKKSKAGGGILANLLSDGEAPAETGPSFSGLLAVYGNQTPQFELPNSMSMRPSSAFTQSVATHSRPISTGDQHQGATMGTVQVSQLAQSSMAQTSANFQVALPTVSRVRLPGKTRN